MSKIDFKENKKSQFQNRYSQFPVAVKIISFLFEFLFSPINKIFKTSKRH
jgi:hypothetical protein